jgi:hypothetical protein
MTVKLKCPVCGDYGVLMKKTTITQIAKRKYRYEKWYVYHNRSKGTTQRWCYLSKKYQELPEINEAILREQATQNTTQTTQNTHEDYGNLNKLESSSNTRKKQKKKWAGSLVRLGHLLDVQKVAGSNPARPTTTWICGFFFEAYLCIFQNVILCGQCPN